jgi:hypothetical protein
MLRAGGGDFERALGLLLPAHIAQIGNADAGDEIAALRGLQGDAAAEMIDQNEKRRRGDAFATGPRRFRSARFRTHERGVNAVRGHCRRQGPWRIRKRAIKPKFGETHDAIERIARQGADRGHRRQHNGQILVRPLFRQIGGREIDDQTPGRDSKANRSEGGAHTLAAFGDGFIAQADDDDSRLAAGELDLDLNRPGFEPREGDRHDAGARPHNPRLYPQTGLQAVQS